MKPKIPKLDCEEYCHKDDTQYRVIYPEIIRMLRDVKGRTIVDYGCGDGVLLEELARLGANIKGYDISKEMITRSRRLLGNKGDLEVIESGNIPLPDNSLDAVVSSLVLMMCPSLKDIEKIFGEVNRVLKPQGSWIFSLTHPAFIDRELTCYRNIFTEDRDYFRLEQPYQFVIINQDRTEVTDDSFIDYNYTLSTYLNLLPKQGFEFRELKEVKVSENNYPPFIVVHGVKK